MAAPSYSARVIADGATNYWRLDETSGQMRDSVGVGHGTVTGSGVTRGVPGALADGSKGANFNGVSGQIDIAALSLAASYSFEAWVRFSGQDTANRVILLAPGWIIYSPGPRNIISYAGVLVPPSTPVTTFPVNDGRLHHIVSTFDGATRRGYLDGVLDVTTAQVGTGAAGGNGSIGGQTVDFWDGLIDDVSLYAYALTPAQITAHYQLGVGTFEKPKRHKSSAAPSVDRKLLVGAVAAGTVSPAIDIAGAAAIALTVVGNGSVSAGAVQLEEAHDIGYAGAWAPLVVPTPVVPGVTSVKVSGTAKAVRARVSTAIVGGSASVSLVVR